MKSLKVLACATCLLGTVTGVGLAKDVQTIGGSMVVPNNVNVVSASKANTPSFITSFITNQEKADPSSANPVNAQIKEFIKNLGTNFDVYQLQGADKTGQKDAFVVAVDVKEVAQQLAAFDIQLSDLFKPIRSQSKAVYYTQLMLDTWQTKISENPYADFVQYHITKSNIDAK